MKPLAIDPDAEHELRQAAARYDAEKSGVGGQFLREFTAAAARVRGNPLSYAIEDGLDVRLCPLRRFPYAIIYLDEPARVWVVAVADLRRRPGYWARRLPG